MKEDMFFYHYSNEQLAAAASVCNMDLKQSLEVISIFEKDFAKFQHTKYALSCCNGTMAMMEALWACGVGKDTEVIAPAMTYWASVFPAISLGAEIKYVDIDPIDLCISPKEIEKNITPKTKAIVAVHLYGHPCRMNEIMDIAKKNGIYVIEDFSHAHGAEYFNSYCGSIGDIGIASCMREKPFPLLEGGVVCTNDKTLYERCCAFGHYRYLGCNENGKMSTAGCVSDPILNSFAGTAIGAVKNRISVVSAAIGVELLENYSSHIAEVYKATSYFMDIVETSDKLIGHRIREKGSTMGGWYMPKLFVTSGNAEQIARKISESGYPCNVGHKYYSLPQHVLNYNRHVFQNSQKLFTNGLITQYDTSDQVFYAVEHTNKTLISAPRFLHYDEAVIEHFGEIYLNAVKAL